MGYGSVAWTEVGRTAIYDDEFSFDHHGGFGGIPDLLRKVTTVAPRQSPSPVAPSSPTYSPVPLPPPIPPFVGGGPPPRIPAPGRHHNRQRGRRRDPSTSEPPPVNAHTTVGPPVGPTVPGPSSPSGGDGGGLWGGGSGGTGPALAGVAAMVTSPIGLTVLALIGVWALRKSGGQRRF